MSFHPPVPFVSNPTLTPCPAARRRSTPSVLRLVHRASALAACLTAARLLAFEPVVLPLGGNLQSIIDAHPPGTRYVLSAGVHRGASIVPKDGDVISGEPGAVLNGCLVLDEWTFDGEWWSHDAPVVTPMSSPSGVSCAEPLCTQPQDFYLDGSRLRPVQALNQLGATNAWYLDRANARVYLRADPTGRLAELGGPSRTAIDCAPLGRPWPVGVVIEDLTIEQYPCPPQEGAVRLGEGCVLRRCTIARSHSYGVRLMSGASVVQDCYITDNGMCGIGGTGIGAVIEGCEISHNVWSMFAGLAWDNGGVKVAGTRDTVFRRNYIHNNKGPGLWWDIKTTLMTVEDNIVEYNHWEGILMEIGDQAIIRRNICRWNGVLHRRNLWGAQICIQNGSGADIYDNYIETGPDFNSPLGSKQGIIVINQSDRAWDEAHYQGKFGVRKIRVHDNIHVMPSGGHNGVDYGTLGWATYEDFLASGLEWRDNRYLVGRPLNQLWSWRLQPNWNATVGKWLHWHDWSNYQDEGSTVEVIGPYDYPPTGTAQFALIEEATGHDYALLKSQLIRRPPLSSEDLDEDGLPDTWERAYFPSIESFDGSSDPDADGLTNAQEFAAGTHPLKADSDDDGLPDGWERAHDLNPLVFDSHIDSDGDGRPIYEEYADGTDFTVPEPSDLPSPEEALAFWLTPSSRLTTNAEGVVTRWVATSAEPLSLGLVGTPKIAATTPTGLPLIHPGVMLLVPGAEDRWGTPASGFTLSLVFQPTEIDITREWRAILTNEVYLNQGFRLRLESGYLLFSTGQSGGSLQLTSHTRLTVGKPHLITIAVGPNGTGGSLYLDGRLEATSPTGVVIPSPASLALGHINGVVQQPGAFGDIVLFRRLLTNRERRSVEDFIQKKMVSGLPNSQDRDLDGLPDDWETTAGLDPLTPDALGDEDKDGVTNLVEFELGLNPQSTDTDGDGLPDGWELLWGTNPLLDDAGADPDGDGLSNLEEFQNGSDPQTPDVDPPFLSFQRIRLWWRADHGLETEESNVIRWRDSAAHARHGERQDPDSALAVGGTLWSGRPVVRLAENALVSATPVDPVALLHAEGLTLSMAVRPAENPPATGFLSIFSFGDLVVGAELGRLVLRNQDGSLSATATATLPAGPFILTCLTGSDSEPARLFVNGTAVLELTGITTSSPSHFTLGGSDPYPADIGEVILHAGPLSPLDRRFVDLVLQAKWLGAGRLTADSDGDSLPDWWEFQACSNPHIADAELDSDWDGENNLAAFEAGRPGFVWSDTDTDGMHDAWETLHDLDPESDDSGLDPDEDGLPNALEFALLTDPRAFDGIDAWGITETPDANPFTLILHLRVHQRSWAYRPHWTATTSLAPEPWSWLPPATIAETAASVAVEHILIPLDETNGASRRFFRLGLLAQ